jgi:hypothetical protein
LLGQPTEAFADGWAFNALRRHAERFLTVGAARGNA